MLDLVDKALNQMALLVQMLVIFTQCLAVGTGWDHRDRPIGDDEGADPKKLNPIDVCSCWPLRSCTDCGML